jgi:1-pyrroline-5-carboxylate dehydrogenase
MAPAALASTHGRFSQGGQLISTTYRFQINAASMLSTSKNAHQAEIDAACEMIDFLRFNVYYARQIYAEQPLPIFLLLFLIGSAR